MSNKQQLNNLEDRTMTENKLRTLNESELDLACGGGAAKSNPRVGSSIYLGNYIGVVDSGSMFSLPDPDTRYPTRPY